MVGVVESAIRNAEPVLIVAFLVFITLSFYAFEVESE